MSPYFAALGPFHVELSLRSAYLIPSLIFFLLFYFHCLIIIIIVHLVVIAGMKSVPVFLCDDLPEVVNANPGVCVVCDL